MRQKIWFQIILVLTLISSGAYISCNKQYTLTPSASSATPVPTATVTSICGSQSHLGNAVIGSIESGSNSTLLLTKYQLTQPALVYSISFFSPTGEWQFPYLGYL
jgi:hypothetical protein